MGVLIKTPQQKVLDAIVVQVAMQMRFCPFDLNYWFNDQTVTFKRNGFELEVEADMKTTKGMVYVHRRTGDDVESTVHNIGLPIDEMRLGRIVLSPFTLLGST